VTLKEEIAIQDGLNLMQQVAEKRTPSLLEEVTLLDIYRSENIGTGLKNVTFHFVYRDKLKTIEQEDVEAEHQRILKEVSQGLEKL
jgi:phenylalanyl-tRNA synthetase beta chain